MENQPQGVQIGIAPENEPSCDGLLVLPNFQELRTFAYLPTALLL